jgi:hypothetical protein
MFLLWKGDAMRDREIWGRPARDDLGRDAPRRPYDALDEAQTDYSRDYGYDPVHRTGYRIADAAPDRNDFGQADYGEDYGYDPVNRRGYRRVADDREPYSEAEAREAAARARRNDDPVERRSWMDRAGDGMSSWFGGRPRHQIDNDGRRRPREAPSDRVIWTVVTQRLANERGLDASDIEVLVDRAEVTLNGTVRDRQDKRRAEDLAELRGVPHVQNNLRVRRHGFHF